MSLVARLSAPTLRKGARNLIHVFVRYAFVTPCGLNLPCLAVSASDSRRLVVAPIVPWFAPIMDRVSTLQPLVLNSAGSFSAVRACSTATAKAEYAAWLKK